MLFLYKINTRGVNQGVVFPTGTLVKSAVEQQSGVPVMTESKGAQVTTERESVPVQPVKGASQSDPTGAPANVGGKSGGEGGKPKSSSKKGEEEEDRKE